MKVDECTLTVCLGEHPQTRLSKLASVHILSFVDTCDDHTNCQHGLLRTLTSLLPESPLQTSV